MELNILKIFGLSSFSFFVGILITPILTHYLYKYKAWKKNGKTKTLSGEEAVVTNSLSSRTLENKTPRMGGILIWTTTLFITLLFFVFYKIAPSAGTEKMNFLSRSQTWLPLFALVSASIIGLIDDILQVRGKGKY
ncbi:MAG: hypothetical protein ABII97_01125, partial [Patescibacteria group bacterium]